MEDVVRVGGAGQVIDGDAGGHRRPR
jgi:hypothetical protein